MMAMTHADMKALANGLAPVVADHVKQALAPLHERIAELESRLVEVEKGGLAYRGVYQKANGYKRGDVATCNGSAWVCLRDTESGETPGKSDGWQLMAKGSR